MLGFVVYMTSIERNTEARRAKWLIWTLAILPMADLVVLLKLSAEMEPACHIVKLRSITLI